MKGVLGPTPYRDFHIFAEAILCLTVWLGEYGSLLRHNAINLFKHYCCTYVCAIIVLSYVQ